MSNSGDRSLLRSSNVTQDADAGMLQSLKSNPFSRPFNSHPPPSTTMRRSYNSRRAWNRPAQPAQPILPNDASLNTPQWDRIMKHPVYNLEQRLGSDIVIPPGWSRELVVQLMKRNMLSAYGSADALEKSLDDVMDTPPERTFGKPVGTVLLLWVLIWLIGVTISICVKSRRYEPCESLRSGNMSLLPAPMAPMCLIW